MIQVANAPVSWGVIEHTPGERAGYVQVLDEISQTGYVGTELGDWGFLPTDADLLRQELQRRDLQLLAAWVDATFEDSAAIGAAEARALRTAKLLAEVAGEEAFIVLGNAHSQVPMRAQNAGRIRPEQGMSEAGWKAFAGGVNQIARSVKAETGLRTVFHHHCATWVETPAETERLLRMTDPEVVGLCFDTGHYRFGGGDPVEGLAKHMERTWHVHFKDCDPEVASRSRTEGWDYTTSIGEGLFCELGKGEVDFPAILESLQHNAYRGWIVVEQDVLPGMGSPKDSATRSRDYLKSIGI